MSAVAVLAIVCGFLLAVSLLSGVATASPGRDQAGSHATTGNAGTSGVTSSPQPLSTADMNSGGANGQCPGGTYCSTRGGKASGNGNGGGRATGKPCAGCVGKADNKNPPGQERTAPGTTFPNNGYECDTNSGIGRTNPAHTGCATPPGTTPTTPPTTPPTGGTTPAGGTTQSGGTAQTVGTTAVLGEKVTQVPASVLGKRLTQVPPTAVAGERKTSTPSSLPFTGSASDALVTVGATAMVAGVVLLALGAYRRRGSISDRSPAGG